MKYAESIVSTALVATDSKVETTLSNEGFIDVDFVWSTPFIKCNNQRLADFFHIRHMGNGVFEIYCDNTQADILLKYHAKGYDLDEFSGRIRFFPFPDIEVLQHNATKVPGLFNKAYIWDIKLADMKAMTISFVVPSVKEYIKELNIKREQERLEEQQRLEQKQREYLKQLEREYQEEQQRIAILKREREEQAVKEQQEAEHKQKMELLQNIDTYAKDLAEYRKNMVTAPGKALDLWQKFKIDISDACFTLKDHNYRPSSASLSFNLKIVNTNMYTIQSSHYYTLTIIDSRNNSTWSYTLRPHGYSDKDFVSGAAATYMMDINLDHFGDSTELTNVLLSGKCKIGCFPTSLQIIDGKRALGKLTTDGAAFLTKQPEKPVFAVNDPSESERLNKYIETMLRNSGAPATGFEVPVLPADTFSKPLHWYTPTVKNELTPSQ